MAEQSAELNAGSGEATVAERSEAAALGWVDRENFRGGEDAWVDAKTFLDRGRHIMPMLQKNNERLAGTVTQLNARLAAAENATRSANAAIEALQASHDEDVNQQVEAARTELRDEIERASQDGDHKGLAAATDKLTRLNAAEVAADAEGEKLKKPAVTLPAQRQVHPEVAAWYAANAEFVRHPRKEALATAVALEFRQAGDVRVGTAFLDDVATEVEKILGGNFTPGVSRVAGGNGGTGRSTGGSGGGKTYADLPADAKAVCDKMATRLVGPARAHKDLASWRKSYTNQYFAE